MKQSVLCVLAAAFSAGAAPLPEPVFHAPFDGGAQAGPVAPLVARGLSHAPGVAGEAVRMTAAAKSILEYPLSVLPDQRQGTVALWYKPEWADGTEKQWRFLFGFTSPWDRQRLGSGAVFLWHDGTVLRGDISDHADTYTRSLPRRKNGTWRHIAFTWGAHSSELYIDGLPATTRRDFSNPLAVAFHEKDGSPRPFTYNENRAPFTAFRIGCALEGRQADGLIDEVKLFAEPLTAPQVAALAAEYPNPSGDPDRTVWKLGPPPGDAPDGAVIRWLRPGNPCLSDGAGLNLELIEDLALDQEPPPDRFTSTGGHTFGTLGGTRYLETGAAQGDRFAVRFRIPGDVPLACFEWEFPDDKVRTADIIVQPSSMPGNNYELQVGYLTGGEYPNQNRMLTARHLYWVPARDVTVIAMTARENAPAALSRIRLYRVHGGLPPAIGPAAGALPPALPARTLALYFEDPAIGYDFAADFETLIDRTAAYMKHTGQNLFCYPGVWYHGLIGETYNPRGHAEDFLTAWYLKFNAEGLGVMPTFNQQTLPLPDGMTVTKRSLSDGSLHGTCVSIWNTGMPNPGGWHGTPPNFNILHPHTQAVIMRDVETLIAQGAPHPSFKGLDLRLAEHCFHWLGSIRAGYNDYMIDAFTADTGIRVPVDRADPMRGKLYADWLLANAREPWVDWRCRAVAAWHKRIAACLAEARPDLCLSLTLLTPMHPARGEDFTDRHYIERLNREAGVDTRLYADAPNIIIAQGLRPARYRAGYDAPKTDAQRTFLRDVFTTHAYYDSLAAANLPWLHLHDHYWESAVGDPARRPKTAKPLEAPWLREESWRVTTLNPAGHHAMRPYVLPLRYHDLLGITRGGFLIGTYGMEDFLIPFARAFRALPARRFDDVPGCGGILKVRAFRHGGATWFYAVNTDDQPASVTLTADTPAVTDLMTGKPPAEQEGARITLHLAPYQLRSFRADGGSGVTVTSCAENTQRSITP